MKLLKPTIFFLLLFSFAAFAQAQTQKIGHANVELLASFMPEAKSMEQELRTLESKIKENLQIKEAYFKTKLDDYEQKRAKGMAPAEDEAAQKELIKLKEEFEKYAEEQEGLLAKKRQDLMSPILDKLEKAINKVADANGYGYVVNSNIAGNSILVKAPKDDDITLRVVKELGITLPADVEKALIEQK